MNSKNSIVAAKLAGAAALAGVVAPARAQIVTDESFETSGPAYPSPTPWSAFVTATTWVRTSMQYSSSSIIRSMPRTWPSMRRRRLR